MNKIVLAAFFCLALMGSHPVFADDSTSSSTIAAPSSGGLLSDLANGLGNAVKNVANSIEQGVKDAAIDKVLSNPEGVTHVLQGLSGGMRQKDPDLAHINKMYNSAPAGSDERKQLNALFVRVRDGDPKARQEVVNRWVNFQQPKPENPAQAAPPVAPSPAPAITPPPAASDKPTNQAQNVTPSPLVTNEKPPAVISPAPSDAAQDQAPAPAARDNSDLGRGFGGSSLPEQLHLAENHLWNMQNLVTGYNDKIKDLQDQIRHGGDKTSLQGEIANTIKDRDDTINRHILPTQQFLNSHPGDSGSSGSGSQDSPNPRFDDNTGLDSAPGNLTDTVGHEINNEVQNMDHGSAEAESRGDTGNRGGESHAPSGGGCSGTH